MTFDPSQHLSPARKGSPPDYLQVKWRLVWLRDEHPDASIETEKIAGGMESNYAEFKARVSIPGKGSATGHGSESKADFGDFIEKAESKAIGRALAALGFGTQFVGAEMDEGQRIVDSPTPRPQPRPAPAAPAPSGNNRIAYNDPRHQTTYSPKAAYRAEMAARKEIDPEAEMPDDDEPAEVGAVTWTELWKEARKRGINGKEELAAAIGVTNTAAMDPGDILTLLQDADKKKTQRPLSFAG